MGLGQAEVDVGPEGVQGHASLQVPLAPSHLRPTQATRYLDTDALGARLHGVLHRPLHGATEAHPTRQLVGHVLGDESRLELRGLHLEDVELDVAPGHELEVLAQPVGLAAASSDDDARPCRVDVDLETVERSLHLDPADQRVRKLAAQVVADLEVLEEVVLVVLVGVPT